jgi:peptide-methionine (S)-S-oxide reductase
MKTIAIGILCLAAVAACSQSNTAAPQTGEAMSAPAQTETATFAAGCFWCVEEIFRQQPGVWKVTSGYTGGAVKNPTYAQVCGGDTGHAEALQVVFDPQKTTFEKLLGVFWTAHDPTTLNRQGADTGTQYRSAIFTYSDAQMAAAQASLAAENKSGHFDRPIVTEITPATEFHPAEDYHQDYYRLNKRAPYCRAVIQPKLKKLGLQE